MQPVSRKVKCPTCGTGLVWDQKNMFRPFCSERCKNVDLGAWSAEQYTIPENHPTDPNESGNPD
jgi:uncharacterized protein